MKLFEILKQVSIIGGVKGMNVVFRSKVEWGKEKLETGKNTGKNAKVH